MADRIVLGNGYSFPTDTAKTGLNNNVAVIGCTGSGKTCSVVIPRLLNTYETNLVLTDPKRELVETFAPMFRERNYRVLELNLDTPSKSDICFDPLAYAETSEDISKLAASVISALPECNKSDKFWSYSSQLFAELLLRYTLQFKNHPTFADFLLVSRSVRERAGEVAEISISPVLDEFVQSNPLHPLTTCYNNAREVSGRTLASVLITMRSVLSTVFSSETEQMLRTKPTLDIDSLINTKTVLFITTDGADEGTNAYVNLIYDTLLQYIMRKAKEFPGGKVPIPIHLIMDDFACGTTINSFPQMIATFRSKGISSTIILQDESQLNTMYGEAGAKTILNNNDTIVYLGGNDLNTARDISVRLNVPLEDVLYMKLNSLAFFRRGQKPVIAERYPLFEDEEYLKLIRRRNPDRMDKQLA